LPVPGLNKLEKLAFFQLAFPLRAFFVFRACSTARFLFSFRLCGPFFSPRRHLSPKLPRDAPRFNSFLSLPFRNLFRLSRDMEEHCGHWTRTRGVRALSRDGYAG
jgi:hypothetical protein